MAKQKKDASVIIENQEKEEEMEKIGAKGIQTKVLPGFMELLPAEQLVFDGMKATIEEVYKNYGFIPLDTPAIERAEVLLAKAGGETEKQIYRFTKGDNDLALRFDLTVPLARYVSEHANELVFPFRRSHIGKVYRGEKPQKGRYREFYQADIDIIGDGNLSLVNDAEIPSVIYQVFKRLNFGPFVIRINNRKIITGLLDFLGIGELSTVVMQSIDKIEKIGEKAVHGMLSEAGISTKAIDKIFKFIAISGSAGDVFSALRGLVIQNEMFQLGISEIEEVVKHLGVLGVPEDYYMVDLTIARGLDYYTGTVYETTLREHPAIGSVCSGGRYDNLAESYTNRKLPGVGISIGLTRLFSQLREIGVVQIGNSSPAKVLVVPLTPDISASLEIAGDLRSLGIPTEIYFEDAKVKNKLSYANKQGIPFVVLAGEDEISSNLFSIKEMATGNQVVVPRAKIAEYIMEKIR